jgi:para-aminobenzoate synthetase/4-amino-4-deoxychorismate lyase
MPSRALFDFRGAAGVAESLAFGEPHEVLEACSIEQVDATLRAAQDHADAGAWVAGMVSYEAAPAFDTALRVRTRTELPLAWFAVFDAPLPAQAERGAQAAPPALQPDVEWLQYAANIEAIREAIARGDVYQVNYTLRMRGEFAADPRALYERLREAQPDGYCAYLDLGRHQIASVSPELFFRREGERLTTRPMKGTRPRGRHDREDEAMALELRDCPKDRAENLMIVDLLRNDLSRLARPHGVQVPQRFAVEKYPTVWQMTSTVTADVREGIGLAEIFHALFPCGSVTGAPKVKAMQMIAELETSARGVYCGAIGYLKPGGDAAFNVAIRTVEVDGAQATAKCGLGSGVIWDSNAKSEYEEVLVKGRFLQRNSATFSLIETLRLDEGTPVRLDRHLARLEASARYFGFPADTVRWRDAIALRLSSAAAGLARLRLLLDAHGELRIEIGEFPAPRSGSGLVFALARDPVSRDDVFLFHKTTRREVYDRAAAQSPGAFDVLLRNEQGELTEFTRGNVVLEIDGRKLTPALDCGLLDGCLRREWLEHGLIEEARLTRDDLERARRVWFINSLRGPIELMRQCGGDARSAVDR